MGSSDREPGSCKARLQWARAQSLAESAARAAAKSSERSLTMGLTNLKEMKWSLPMS